MPTTYAHDAFGRKVYHHLPKELQYIIHKHIQLYRIGLHGPDILFYHSLKKNKVNQTGTRLHEEIARPFFQRGADLVREERDEALLAYLMGFACHFMLDSTCHPYIYSIEEKVSHTHIEKEMDRRWMIKDGLNPMHYFPACGIHPSKANSETIHKMFPEVSVKDIQKSLRGQRRLTALMVYGGGWRRQGIMSVLKAVGKAKEYGEFFMKKERDTSCESYLKVLDGLFSKALKETPEVLAALYASVKEGDALPARFARDYEGTEQLRF